MKRTIAAIGSQNPFDLELGCFGTLAKLSKRGYEVYLVIAQDNSNTHNSIPVENGGNNISVLLESIQRLSKKIGAHVSFADGFNYSDMSQNNVNVLGAFIRRINPALVFIPFRESLNPSQRVLAESAFLACREIKNVLFYETDINSKFLPSIYSLIQDQEISLKKSCILECRHDGNQDQIQDILNKMNSMHANYAKMTHSDRKLFEAFASHRLLLLSSTSGEDIIA